MKDNRERWEEGCRKDRKEKGEREEEAESERERG